jgi:hypothetical protein
MRLASLVVRAFRHQANMQVQSPLIFEAILGTSTLSNPKNAASRPIDEMTLTDHLPAD